MPTGCRASRAELRAEGHILDDVTLTLTTSLFHKHINPFGRYHFYVEWMRQTLDRVVQDS